MLCSLLQGYGIGWGVWALAHLLGFAGAFFVTIAVESYNSVGLFSQKGGFPFWVGDLLRLLALFVGGMGFPALLIFPIFLIKRQAWKLVMAVIHASGCCILEKVLLVCAGLVRNAPTFSLSNALPLCWDPTMRLCTLIEQQFLSGCRPASLTARIKLCQGTNQTVDEPGWAVMHSCMLMANMQCAGTALGVHSQHRCK